MVGEFPNWLRRLVYLADWSVGLMLALVAFLAVGAALICGDGDPGDEDAALRHAARVAAEASLPKPFPGTDPLQAQRLNAWELGRRLGQQMHDLAAGQPADGKSDVFLQAECEILADRLHVSLPPLPVPSGEPLRDRRTAERTLREDCRHVLQQLERRGDEQTTHAFDVALRLHLLTLVYHADWEKGDEVDLLRQDLARSSKELDVGDLPCMLLWLRIDEHQSQEDVAGSADIVLNLVGMLLSAG